jgi:hypothetical protein
VSTPLERLDRAFAAARDATGAEFFRRFRAYQELVEGDPVIAQAVGGMEDRVTDEQDALDRDDVGRITKLVEIRRELVAREPQLDDSGRPRPPGTLLDMAARNQFLEWQWTLSNFDAIADDTGEGIVQHRGFDRSRTRMLGEILRAKLHGLQFQPGRITTKRPDLDDLTARVDRVLGSHQAQQERLDDLAESSGFLAARRVDLVAFYLRPRDLPGEDLTEDEARERAEAVLLEVSGDFHHLREAVRPEEVRGALTLDQQTAITRHEGKSREDLTALDSALRPLVETVEEAKAPRGWAGLDLTQKLTAGGLAVGLLGVIVAVVAIIAN